MNFAPAVAYLFCLNLSAAFSQPRTKAFFGLRTSVKPFFNVAKFIWSPNGTDLFHVLNWPYFRFTQFLQTSHFSPSAIWNLINIARNWSYAMESELISLVSSISNEKGLQIFPFRHYFQEGTQPWSPFGAIVMWHHLLFNDILLGCCMVCITLRKCPCQGQKGRTTNTKRKKWGLLTSVTDFDFYIEERRSSSWRFICLIAGRAHQNIRIQGQTRVFTVTR